MLLYPGTEAEKRGSKWFASLLHSRGNIYSSNIYYAYFMLTQDSAEELNQNDDDMSCVTGVTCTTGTKFYTQHTQFNIPEEFGHAVDEAPGESKTKRTAAALVNLQYSMGAISHQPRKWEDIEHCHTTYNFGGEIGTYMGQNVKNKTMVKFLRGKKTASKKGVMSRKLARTATSTNDVSQSPLSNELDILLKTFGPS